MPTRSESLQDHGWIGKLHHLRDFLDCLRSDAHKGCWNVWHKASWQWPVEFEHPEGANVLRIAL
jgi:hypothetical protein